MTGRLLTIWRALLSLVVSILQNGPTVVGRYRRLSSRQKVAELLGKTVLGRDLRLGEAIYLADLIGRLAALVALRPQLDAGYAAVQDQAWQTT